MSDIQSIPQRERWRDVEDFPGYQVSNRGQVRSEKTTELPGLGLSLHRGWKVLKPSPNNKGYLRVGLSRNGRSFTRYVHFLVAQAFLGPRPPGMEINHQDGQKRNCRADNLEYTTPVGNQEHAQRLGLYRRGERAPGAKLTEAKVRRAREQLTAGWTHAKIAVEIGVHRATVSHLKSGRNWGWLE